jgi:DNA-binding NarL/FixJ family response regulator
MNYAELRAAYLPRLCPRKAGVAALLADGMVPNRIAPAMGLTRSRVQNDISAICVALACTRRELCKRLRELLA